MGAGIACWLECWTCDRKVVRLNPGRSGGRIFSSRVNFVCWLLLPQWHVTCQHADGRLHLNMHTPLTNEAGLGWLCRCPGIVWEPFTKWAHTQLVRKHSVTVISAHWANVDWSLPKEWSECAQANLPLAQVILGLRGAKLGWGRKNRVEMFTFQQLTLQRCHHSLTQYHSALP